MPFNKRRHEMPWHDLLAIALVMGGGFVYHQFTIMDKNHEINEVRKQFDKVVTKNDELHNQLAKALEDKVKIEVRADKGLDFSDEDYPLGLRYNNPCNVKANHWEGQVGIGAQKFAIFSHYAYGLRAAALALKKYQRVYKEKTLRKMMKRYCPEGNTAAYAKFIGKRLGIGIDEEFDVMAVMPEMLKAIVRYEVGDQPYPDHAFALAGIYANKD